MTPAEAGTQPPTEDWATPGTETVGQNGHIAGNWETEGPIGAGDLCGRHIDNLSSDHLRVLTEYLGTIFGLEIRLFLPQFPYGDWIFLQRPLSHGHISVQFKAIRDPGWVGSSGGW
jgi:hypothetical protein